MKILVTGGTGFVGRAIVSAVRTAGHQVIPLARHDLSSRAREDDLHSGIHIRRGNVLDPDSVREACAGMDAVVHLVGIISEVGDQTFERVHTGGTRNVIAAAREAGVTRYLHMSALGTRSSAAARYHQSKWAAEEIVRQSGLDWTIFRPSIVYGPGDGFVNLFARIIRFSPVVPIIGDGRAKFQPVPVTMVASAFARALVEPRSIGQTYDLAGGEVLTLDEIVDMILRILRRRRMKVHLPVAAARMQAAACEFLFGRLLHTAPPLNRDQVSMLQEDNVGDPRPANALFALSSGRFAEEIASYLA